MLWAGRRSTGCILLPEVISSAAGGSWCTACRNEGRAGQAAVGLCRLGRGSWLRVHSGDLGGDPVDGVAVAVPDDLADDGAPGVRARGVGDRSDDAERVRAAVAAPRSAEA